MGRRRKKLECRGPARKPRLFRPEMKAGAGEVASSMERGKALEVTGPGGNSLTWAAGR